MKWGLLAGGGLLSFLLLLVFGVAASSEGATGCGGGVGQVAVTAIPTSAVSGVWSSEQLINAAHIMNVASSRNLSVKAEQLGVMTAMGESSLRNINYGDDAENPDGSPSDSIGLFQQQSSWGSTADRLDPDKSAGLFFTRLVAVAGWDTIDPSLAAHLVQRNADPNHYTKWFADAVSVTDYLSRTFPASGVTGCTVGEAVLPLDKPYVMTSPYGPRVSPTEGASSWHEGVDLVGRCGAPIYSVLPGRVVQSDRLTLGVQSPDGFTVLYLHSHLVDRSVQVGDQVQRGQQISKVGDEAPATGCHLHLQILVAGNTNPAVAALPRDVHAPGTVNPEDFMKAFGTDVCAPAWCKRDY